MEDFIFKKVLMPCMNTFKKYNRLNYFDIIEKRNKYQINDLKEIQFKKLKKLLNHCYKNVPYYRQIFESIGLHPDDIKTLSDYSKIPILEKTTIRDNYKNLLDSTIDKNELIFSTTGGSTGIPLTIYKSKEDQEYGFALRYRANAWAGWNYWDKSAWILSDLRRLDELDSIKRKLGLYFKRRLLLDTRNSTKADMLKWANEIKKFKPKQIYGYSTLLTAFADFIIDNNIKIDGVQGVFSTAEPLKSRETLSKAFNAKVYDQYGASEIPCIAHECVNGNMHINIDECLVEFVDADATGKVKKIICTPLYVYGMPLLRYDLGDTGAPLDKHCDCGLPYPLMELKVGRISDHFLLSDGKIIPTSAIGWFIARETQGVKQYKIIQEDYDYFIIQLVCPEETRDKNQVQIIKILNNLMQKDNINFTFEFHDEILPDKNGKFRVTISKVLEKSKLNNK